ncbi:MAG: AsmA family protein, partial [Acidiferrobacterales bacterium]
LSGNIRATQFTDGALVQGRLQVQPVDLQALLSLLALDLPATATNAFDKVELNSEFSADLGQQTLKLSNMALAAGELAVSGNLKARQFPDNPQLSGDIEVPEVDVRTWLKKMGATVDTADKKALQKLALKSNFTASAQQIALSKLALTLDETRLTGKASARNLAKPAYRFDLRLDKIDLDRYLPAPSSASAPASTGTAAVAARRGGASPPAAALPLDALRALNLQGRATITKLKAFGIRSANAVIQLAANNGRLTIGPSKAALYGGGYRGKTIVDVRGNTPKFTIDEKLGGVKVGPFLSDAQISDRLTGTGDLALNLTARGSAPEAITKTLTGKVVLNLQKGKIKGVDLQKMVNDVVELAEKLKGETRTLKPKPTDSTPYNLFRATVILNNGIATNNDLDLQGPFLLANEKQGGLWATGRGTADLVKQTLKYRVKAKIAEDATRKGTTIPIDVVGPFADLEYKPDYGAVVEQAVKRKVDKKLEKKKKKLKDELKEKLRKKFKR